ncbi:MAG: hypothetical protein ABSA84_05080 [Gammaproteobacteria bacterium]
MAVDLNKKFKEEQEKNTALLSRIEELGKLLKDEKSKHDHDMRQETWHAARSEQQRDEAIEREELIKAKLKEAREELRKLQESKEEDTARSAKKSKDNEEVKALKEQIKNLTDQNTDLTNQLSEMAQQIEALLAKLSMQQLSPEEKEARRIERLRAFVTNPENRDHLSLPKDMFEKLLEEKKQTVRMVEEEEKLARKVVETKVKLEMEKVKGEMRDLLKQNEEEEKAILKATEEQLRQAGKPLSQEEKDKLSAALFEMQNNRRKVMQNIVNNDSRFDTLLRMAENKSLDFGQKAVRMVRKVAGQDAADSGIVKMFSESLEKRRSELYPPGQLNDHTIQRNAAKTVILAAGAAALQALEVPVAVKSLLYFTTCESGWKYQTHLACTRHLNHISDDVIIQRGMAAKAALGLMGSLVLGAGVKLAQEGVKFLIKKPTQSQSIKDSFEVDPEQFKMKYSHKRPRENN